MQATRFLERRFARGKHLLRAPASIAIFRAEKSLPVAASVLRCAAPAASTSACAGAIPTLRHRAAFRVSSPGRRPWTWTPRCMGLVNHQRLSFVGITGREQKYVQQPVEALFVFAINRPYVVDVRRRIEQFLEKLRVPSRGHGAGNVGPYIRFPAGSTRPIPRRIQRLPFFKR